MLPWSVYESNDKTIEESITNIQNVRRTLTQKIRELRNSDTNGAYAALRQYEDILTVIHEEENEVLAFSRQHARNVEKKTVTINKLQQFLDQM